MQVRFYEPPSGAATRWPYQEVYSFYTHRAWWLVYGDMYMMAKPICSPKLWILSERGFDHLVVAGCSRSHPNFENARTFGIYNSDKKKVTPGAGNDVVVKASARQPPIRVRWQGGLERQAGRIYRL